MQTLKSYFTNSQVDKYYFSSINGGFLNYLPLEGTVYLSQDNQLNTKIIPNSEYFEYYQKSFGLPECKELGSAIDNNKKLILFDEIPFNDPLFINKLQASGLNISNESLKLNNKYYFQALVKKILGEIHSTNPFLIKKYSTFDSVTDILKTLLKKNEKIIIKISDETVAQMGADHTAVISSLPEFLNFCNGIFSNPENGEITLLNNKMLLQYDLIVEKYISHYFSPSITFFLHNESIEILSLNYQFLENGSFIGSTDILPNELEIYRENIVRLAKKIAMHAHSIGARGFLGLDTIVNNEHERNVIFVEANYRTTGSTVPKITADKAARYECDVNWLYLGSFYYNNSVSSVEELLNLLQEKNILYTNSDSFLEGKNKLQCTITFGEREKRCGLCFFWKKNSIPFPTVLNTANSLLSVIKQPSLFSVRDYL